MLRVWSPPSQLVPISQLVPNIQVVPTVNSSPPILPYIFHQKFPLNIIQNCPPKNQDLIFAQFTWSSLHLSPPRCYIDHTNNIFSETKYDLVITMTSTKTYTKTKTKTKTHRHRQRKIQSASKTQCMLYFLKAGG